MVKPEQAYLQKLEDLTEQALTNSLTEEDRIGLSFFGLRYRRAAWFTTSKDNNPALAKLGEGHLHVGRARYTDISPGLLIKDGEEGTGELFTIDFKRSLIAVHIVAISDFEALPYKILRRHQQDESNLAVSEPTHEDLQRLADEMRRGASGAYSLKGGNYES